MEKRKKTVNNTAIGAFVNQDYFNMSTENYQKQFQNTDSSFVISKSLLTSILNQSEAIDGIRFTYGLADKLNSNSVRILMIPCVSGGMEKNWIQPMLLKEGYYDHLENIHSCIEVSELTANFIADIKSRCNDLNYAQITRSGFIGREKIEALIENKRCNQVTLHLGYKNGVIQPVFEAQDTISNSITASFMNMARPVPPFGQDEGEQLCPEDAVKLQNVTQEEFNEYRVFRDYHLLNMEGGSIYYELYFFIIPHMKSLIETRGEQESILNKLYNNQTTPFHELLMAKRYEEAFELLKETLNTWVELHQKESAEEYAWS